MKITRFAEVPYVPAGHEDPNLPGVWKKVLFEKSGLQPGRVQMVNWARLPPGRSFAPHYHEDMQEVFVIVAGQAEIRIGQHTATLARGDSILIDAREVHQMSNRGTEDVEYLAMGITRGEGGRTVNVEGRNSNVEGK
jgi:mannose-6-phosphate isomerase-like protein (cupin superfamily)